MSTPKCLLSACMAALLLAPVFAIPQSNAAASLQGFRLMPVPAAVTAGAGKLQINEKFHAVFTGYSEPRLTRALARFLERLGNTHRHAFHSRVDNVGSGIAGHPLWRPRRGHTIDTADESYTLEITSTQARLSAPSPLGILHGMETLLQLVDVDAESFYIPAVNIQDRPRFPWRGLMIDAARHWQPVEAIKRNLDGMAAVKMNVFHWHLSEDQGFRVESKKFP